MQKITGSADAGRLKYATKYFASEQHEFSTGGVEWRYVLLICIVFFFRMKIIAYYYLSCDGMCINNVFQY